MLKSCNGIEAQNHQNSIGVKSAGDRRNCLEMKQELNSLCPNSKSSEAVLVSGLKPLYPLHDIRIVPKNLGNFYMSVSLRHTV